MSLHHLSLPHLVSIHYLVRLPHQVSLPNSVGLPYIVRPPNLLRLPHSMRLYLSSGDEALSLEAASIIRLPCILHLGLLRTWEQYENFWGSSDIFFGGGYSKMDIFRNFKVTFLCTFMNF